MARPKKCRRICAYPLAMEFAPAKPEGETVTLAVDEFETIRLLDLEGLTQEQCARQMNVARATVTAMYEQARRKLALAITKGRRLQIAGGDVQLCCHAGACCGRCGKDDCEKMQCERKCNRKEEEEK